MSFFSRWFGAASFKEKHSGIEFPKAMGGYKRGEITHYGEAGGGTGGVAIAYASEGAEVTLYVRAPAAVDVKTSEEFLQDSLAGIREFEARGHYRDVQIYECDAAKERPGWKSAAFTASAPTAIILSFIHCKVTPGYLVKIRASIANPEVDSLEPFTKTLQELIDHAKPSTVRPP